VSEKDLISLWEEDGDLERMKAFFQRFDTDTSKKDRIKQLTLEKLAQTDTLISSDTENNDVTGYEKNPTRSKHPVDSTWIKRLAALRRGWGFKLAVPAVLIILLAVVGPQAYNTRLYDLGSRIEVQNSTLDSLAAPQEVNKLKRLPNMSQSDQAAYGSSAGSAVPVPPVPEAVPPADSGVARKITQNVSVILQVDNVSVIINKISERVQGAGGYVVESQLSSAGNSANGHITVKIPATGLDSFKASLPSWGKVLDQHLTSNDITNQYYDAQTRLEAWETEQKRYLEILKQAKTIDDIMKIENALATIRQQIEQLKGQLKLWNNQVDYSTVQIQLQTKPSLDVQVDNPWQPVSWQKTWSATKNAVLKTISITWNAVNYVIIGIGYAFPYLIMVALCWLGYRFWKRKKA
jgi:hypothetical protein